MLRTAIFQLRDDQHAVLVVVGLQSQNKEIQLVSNHTTAASLLLCGGRGQFHVHSPLMAVLHVHVYWHGPLHRA